MTSKMILEERFEQLMKANAKTDAHLWFHRKQLDQAMRNNRREIQSSRSTSESHSTEEDFEDYPFVISEEEEAREPRRRRGGKQLAMGFKVEIPEFEGQLNPDEFLDWMSTVESVFEYKDIPNDKKLKLMALKLD